MFDRTVFVRTNLKTLVQSLKEVIILVSQIDLRVIFSHSCVSSFIKLSKGSKNSDKHRSEI